MNEKITFYLQAILTPQSTVSPYPFISEHITHFTLNIHFHPNHPFHPNKAYPNDEGIGVTVQK